MRGRMPVGIGALMVMFLLTGAVSQAAEATLQDAINARMELTILTEEVLELDAEVRRPMRRAIANGEAQQTAGNILLTKDRYTQAVEAYERAAAFYRQALGGREILERLATAWAKTDRARMLAEPSADAAKLAAPRRLELNAEGYVQAAEFEHAIAERKKAREAYEALLAPGKPTKLEEVVGARTAMLAARRRVKNLPTFEPGGPVSPTLAHILETEGPLLTEKGHKRGSLPDLISRAIRAHAAGSDSLQERDYTPARALFAQAEQLYREAAPLQVQREMVVAGQSTAEASMKLADSAFKTHARPASFERGKQSLADGAQALAEEELDKATDLFAKAVELFEKAQGAAKPVNEFAEAQDAWAAAMAAVDDELLQEYAAAQAGAVRMEAARAEKMAAADKFQEATAVLKQATLALKATENVAKAAPIMERLQGAIAGKDKFGAEDILAELEALIPADGRMPGLRQKVAAVPGPRKALTLGLGGGTRMELVLVRPGTFMMGSEDAVAGEKPVHEVRITRHCYMGKYEVTQTQYETVMGTNPSHFEGKGRPVEAVSWNDAIEFCRRLSENTGRTVRLPTEAEWEYACRAGTTTRFSFGDGNDDLEQHGWASANSRAKTHTVGQKRPNAWGLYDMHGNVREWCADWSGPYAEDAQTDPGGPAAGLSRVLRGGSWNYATQACRSASRDWYGPTGTYHGLGFRVVVVAE